MVSKVVVYSSSKQPPINASTMATTMTNFADLYYKGRHLPKFVQATATASETVSGEAMTPGTAEVSALTTGAWFPGWKADAWTPIPSFEENWALASTSEARARLLDTYYPLASASLTYYQRSILMSVRLPATKSSHLDAELTFCDGTLSGCLGRFSYCVEDTPDGEGYWYCDECRCNRDEDEEED
jgi:hypothetical protein